MNLKLLITVESLICGALVGLMVYLTKFVYFFEVELEMAMITMIPFYTNFGLGLAFVFGYLRRVPAWAPNKKTAKRYGHHLLVKFSLLNFLIVLIGLVMMLRINWGYDYGANYRRTLAAIYNETNGEANIYLDTLHPKFACCGTMDMNATGDPTLIKLNYDMTTKLPRSCCPGLAEDEQCTFESIYQRPCDPEHLRKVHIFDIVSLTLLIIWCLWKVAFHFAYQNHGDSLFANMLTKDDLIQAVPKA